MYINNAMGYLIIHGGGGLNSFDGGAGLDGGESPSIPPYWTALLNGLNWFKFLKWLIYKNGEIILEIKEILVKIDKITNVFKIS